MFQITLDIIAPTGSQRKIVKLEELGKVYLGSQKCDVLLEHPKVSRRHVGFTVRAGRLIAGDLQSANGTLHNGKPLKQAYVRPGDILQAGPIQIKVVAFGVEQAAVTREAPNKKAQAKEPHGQGIWLPLMDGQTDHVKTFRDFYLGFLADPKNAWRRIEAKGELRQLAITLVKHILLYAAFGLVGAVLSRGFLFNPIGLGVAAINLVLWSMAGWGVGLALIRYVIFPMLRIQANWEAILVYAIACSALSLPVQALMPVLNLVGLSIFGIILVSTHSAFCLYGTWRMFRPDRGRFMILAGTMALLMFLSVSTAVTTMRMASRLESSVAQLTSGLERMRLEIPRGLSNKSTDD